MKNQILRPINSILITGASSGIGKALALEYAGNGVFMALTGRNAERLRRVEAECRAKGAEVQIAIIDATDISTMEAFIKSLPHLDLVIANAGISGGTAEGTNNDAVREVFSVNVGGVINTILPTIEKFKIQGGGQLALMSSMSAYRGLPSAPAYSASKACVKAYAQALRGSLYNDGIEVSAICPGYVATPLTDKNKFPMPLLMGAGKAARIIKKGLDKNKAVIVFPLTIRALLALLNILPHRWSDKIFRSLPKKDWA